VSDPFPDVPVAESFRARLLGLAWRDRSRAGPGLLIPRCAGVHTFGMRFPLDVAFVDEGGAPIRIARAVPRRRLLTERRAFAVIESRAGEIARFVGRGPRSVG
jgi:uncharacterized membrane protein (UPF0127 family)